MAFEYSEEQRSLHETIKRSFSDTITSDFLRGVVEGKHRGEKVKTLATDLGLFEFFSDEGPSLIELMLIAVESGRVLLPSNLTLALFAGPFLTRISSEYKKSVSLSAEELNGVKAGALRIGIGITRGDVADFVSSDEAIRVMSLNPNTQKLTVAKVKSAKGEPHASLDLTSPQYRYKIESSLEIQDPRILPALRVVIAAELSGIASRVVDMTREYVATRKQFGAPIGSFQAVQQQISDMYLKSESLLSLVQFAAWTFENSKDQLDLASLSALGYAIDVVPQSVETAIQLHGGIGFTWEYDLHLYLRRARMLTTLFALTDSEYESVLSYSSQTV